MTKFILLMLVCSNIPGNDCKPISTPIPEFNTYFGYDYSSMLLKEMTPAAVDEYQMYTRFDCKESSTI